MKYSAYLNLGKKRFDKRIKKARTLLTNCRVCPRKCGVNRLEGERGFCKLGAKAMVSSHHLHFGEESCLVGRRGSGTIFFTRCNLACVYCQNYDISQLSIGAEVDAGELAQMMMELQSLGCHNINFVTPTSQVPQILEALPLAVERGLKIPLVYNTNAYDSIETLKLLDGIVDIYMPDAKYADDKVAQKYSAASDYFDIMKKAIREMHWQVGDLVVEDGIAKRGLLVRHLVLPNDLAGTQEVMKFLAAEISKNTFINIMDQYRPYWKASEYPELEGPITKEEYEEAVEMVKKWRLRLENE
ncbi:MAG: radical SAM protein [Candidatus Moranbacteria bacterium CG_4_8_14_3_um_filter_43_15]|nr:MAG: radical SAM protein [Candidatus Moranbacteria bacterium CG_4_8_14_3_um_filter_43_15]